MHALSLLVKERSPEIGIWRNPGLIVRAGQRQARNRYELCVQQGYRTDKTTLRGKRLARTEL